MVKLGVGGNKLSGVDEFEGGNLNAGWPYAKDFDRPWDDVGGEVSRASESAGNLKEPRLGLGFGFGLLSEDKDEESWLFVDREGLNVVLLVWRWLAAALMASFNTNECLLLWPWAEPVLLWPRPWPWF